MAAGQDPAVASHGTTLCGGKIAKLLGVFLTIKIFLSLIRFNWCNYRFWLCMVGWEFSCSIEKNRFSVGLVDHFSNRPQSRLERLKKHTVCVIMSRDCSLCKA